MPGVNVKRVFAVALAACVLAAPAYAQNQDKGDKDDEPLVQIEKTKKRDREDVDKQYSRAMQRTSSKGTEAVKTDPWSNMRGPDDPKAKK
jgi:hypothetical protein